MSVQFLGNWPTWLREFVMVRNLRISNGLPCNPGRFCRYSMGAPIVIKFAKPMIIMIGAARIMPALANIMSIERFTLLFFGPLKCLGNTIDTCLLKFRLARHRTRIINSWRCIDSCEIVPKLRWQIGLRKCSLLMLPNHFASA